MKRILSCGLFILLIMLLPVGLLAANYVAEATAPMPGEGLTATSRPLSCMKRPWLKIPTAMRRTGSAPGHTENMAMKPSRKKLKAGRISVPNTAKAACNMRKKPSSLDPNKPDGHYYYGLNVGIYSDGVSIFTALAEGLKDKTQTSFEKTYEIDKMYKEAGPMLSLGRFWAVLPWPMRDRKKSLQYYREYQATQYFADNLEAHFYIGEVLYQIGGDENKAEAKGLLEKAAKSEDPFFRDKAKELLTKIK